MLLCKGFRESLRRSIWNTECIQLWIQTETKRTAGNIKLIEYLNDGYIYIVDIDLEKFSDNALYDKLISIEHVIRKVCRN